MLRSNQFHPTLVLILMLILLLPSSAFTQFYNGSQMSFGKNRIQYKEFLWTYYKFDDYDVYFYLNGRELAVATAKYAKMQIPLMEKNHSKSKLLDRFELL